MEEEGGKKKGRGGMEKGERGKGEWEGKGEEGGRKKLGRGVEEMGRWKMKGEEREDWGMGEEGRVGIWRKGGERKRGGR